MSLIVPVSTTRREYKLSSSRRLSHAIWATIFLAIAVFFFKLSTDPYGRDFALCIGAIAFTTGVYFALLSFRSQLTLDGDVMELRSALRVRRINRTEIEGLRTLSNQYGTWTCIYSTDGHSAIKISDYFNGKEDIAEWLKGAPDLDQRDADKITEKINRQETEAALNGAKTQSFILSIFAGIVSLPVMFICYAPVYKTALILLLACPLIAIVLLKRRPLFFTLFRKKLDPRADLGFLVAWPGIGILFSYQNATDPAHLIDSAQIFLWALFIFACLLFAILRIIWKSTSRVGILFFMVISGGVYSLSVARTINSLSDTSASHIYQTRILRMYSRSGSKGERYFVSVAPWGPTGGDDDVNLPLHDYRKLHVDDNVCYELHSGFLHARWYISTPCPASNHPTISKDKPF